jgi:hypothetical protein
MRRTSPPLRKRGSVATKRGVVHRVKDDSEEGDGLVGRVWLELGMNLYYEGRSDGGEQTGLRPKSARARPNDVHDLRISMLCSNPRHISS